MVDENGPASGAQTLMSRRLSVVAVGVGAGVSVGGIGVLVGGMGVLVGGTGVLVGGTGVLVG
jgi:hypothetical protein